MQRRYGQLETLKVMLENIKHNADELAGRSIDGIELQDIRDADALLMIINKGANSEQLDKEFIEEAKEFLQKRWQRIANTSKCYTLNQHYIFNIISISLAEHIDSANKNSLLMPGVRLEDTNFTCLNELQLGEFIVADDGEWFILVDEIIEEACNRIISKSLPLFVNKNKDQAHCNLSSAEITRLGSLATTITAINAWFSAHSSNLLSELAILRDCLLRGQVDQNDGEEMNAGVAANIGIANFYAIYSLLSDEEKDQIRALSNGNRNLGSIIDVLFREPESNYRSVNTCIQLLGRALEAVLSYGNNPITLSGMNINSNERLNKLIQLVKSQFNHQDLIANDDPLSRKSRLNPDMQFDETNWVVSLIAPCTQSKIPTYTKIIVEGLVNGQLFVGSYYPIAKTGSTWPLIPDIAQNTAGVISKIQIFESKGYAQIPLQDENGAVAITIAGDISFKFDLVEEMRKSLSRSHVVPANALKTMIDHIKQEATKTNVAIWISPLDGANHTPAEVDAVMANAVRFNLFTPYERFGSKSIFGTGKHNCVTWCEEKLAIAGCGQSSIMDYGKSKPITHISRWL